MQPRTNLRARRTRTGTQSLWRAALLFVASVQGCGGLVGSGSPQPPPAEITVTVAPSAVIVVLGAQQPFAAAVSNSANTAVTWSVNHIPGGNTTVGTINSEGMYTAPAILPTAATVAVLATSVADATKSASASITVSSDFTLLVAGPDSVNAGSSAAYSATFTAAANSIPSRVIFWSVEGSGCTGAACGTISAAGLYAAPAVPPSPATVKIVATPQADPAKAATASVSILASVTVSISPTAATLALGAPENLAAVVTGALDATVTWDVNGVVGGNPTIGTIQNSQTDPNHTTYLAPLTMPAAGSVSVRARSNAEPGKSATAIVSFTSGASVALSPSAATLALGERQTFAVTVSDATTANVIWQVNGIPGGNAAVGQVCVTGGAPCQPVSETSVGSIDYVAPAGVPTPNPVTLMATSAAQGSPSASAPITIVPHILVSVQPASASIAAGAQARFTAIVTGTENQQAIWTVSGAGCGNPADCGAIDASGLYTAPQAPPAPNLVAIVATSSEDVQQSGSASATITFGPAIFSLSPTSAYAGTRGGFTLLVTGNDFSASNPGPGSTLLVAGRPQATACDSSTQCITALSSADLASSGNLSVQIQNPDGSLSNLENFVVLAPGSGLATIPLTPGAPVSDGNDIVVVELSTNGGTGVPGNVSLNVAAMGAYLPATSSCTLGGNPVIVRRPAQGVATADVCVFSISALDPSFEYSVSGPASPDIAVINREPLGLGMMHLTLQVQAAAAPGIRTLFIRNPKGDTAAGTGAIEVQ